MAFDRRYELPNLNLEAQPASFSPGTDMAFQPVVHDTWGPHKDKLPSAPVRDREEQRLCRSRASSFGENIAREIEEQKATVVRNQDGTSVFTNARGQVIRVDQPDGGTKRYSYDGKGNLNQVDHWLPGEYGSRVKVASTVRRPDGTWATIGPDCQALGKPMKGELKVNRDGSTLWKGADGTATVVRSDGSSETRNPDGSHVSRNKFGQVTRVSAADRKTQADRGPETKAQAGSGEFGKRPRPAGKGGDRRKDDPAAPIKVEKTPDGDQVAHLRNGDKVTTYAKPTQAGVKRTIERKDGSYTDEYVDGRRTTVKKDNTKIFEYPKGNRDKIVKKIEHPNGATFREYDDGMQITVNLDNDPNTVITHPDGSETYVFNDESRMVLGKDGSLTKVNPDGSQESLPAGRTKEELRLVFGIGFDHRLG